MSDSTYKEKLRDECNNLFHRINQQSYQVGGQLWSDTIKLLDTITRRLDALEREEK